MTILTKPPQIRPAEWPGQVVTLGGMQDEIYRLREQCRIFAGINGAIIGILRPMLEDSQMPETAKAEIRAGQSKITCWDYRILV